MNPRVTHVIACPDHTLRLTFENGEIRLFDVKPYLGKGVFKELQNIGYFKTVRVESGSIAWPHEQDLCPDTLYLCSIPISSGEGALPRVAEPPKPYGPA